MAGFLSDNELDAAIKAAVLEHAHPVDEEGNEAEIGGVGLDDANLLRAVKEAFTDAGWSKTDGV